MGRDKGGRRVAIGKARKESSREEENIVNNIPSNKDIKKITIDPDEVSFSFKYFIEEYPSAQNIQQWIEDGLISPFIHRMKDACSQKARDAVSRQVIKIYGKFPENPKGFNKNTKITEFKCPSNLSEINTWGVLKNIGGQISVAVGFLTGNVFNIVFLDKDHKFYISRKKNT